MRGVVDHLQQAMIDLVALGEQLVQVHGAHHRADIGHGQIEDRDLEIGHLVARECRIQHLEEGHAVDPDHGVVLGDHLLARHLDHLLHDIELASDAVDEGNDQGQPGTERARIAAEALDGVVPPLRHHLDAGRQHGDEQNQQDEDEDIEAEHGTLLVVSNQHGCWQQGANPSYGCP